MAGKSKDNYSPRIANRRALHDYFIEAKLECGIVLLGSEVKSIREATAQIHESFARVEDGELILHNAHIDLYAKGNADHIPNRPRKLLAHRREIKKLEAELAQRGTTLVPLAIYFKGGRAKVEIGVAHGKQQFDKRATIKKKEQDREL
ncbi:MAG TPA: SsrA-binding protein SmpB, partial [Tepidisphaeraceae bacterium]|nr:SsrA-binding protein SmpB [Tepidisphaeraceae bacterium]